MVRFNSSAFALPSRRHKGKKFYSLSTQFNPLPIGTALFSITRLSLVSLYAIPLPPIKTAPLVSVSGIDCRYSPIHKSCPAHCFIFYFLRLLVDHLRELALTQEYIDGLTNSLLPDVQRLHYISQSAAVHSHFKRLFVYKGALIT